MSQSPFLAPAASKLAAMRRAQDLRVQDKLKMYGIGSSPLEKLALTALSANNRARRGDISTNAQAEVKSKAGKESLLAGITAPAGYFDPLGLATTVTAGKLLFYREVELKHGRVAMLAALGMVVGEQFHPLFGGDINVPAYIAF